MIFVIQTTLQKLALCLTPNTLRVLFFGRVRVALYLSTGAVIKMNVRSWKLNPRSEYSFEGGTHQFIVDAEDVIASKQVYWW